MRYPGANRSVPRALIAIRDREPRLATSTRSLPLLGRLAVVASAAFTSFTRYSPRFDWRITCFITWLFVARFARFQLALCSLCLLPLCRRGAASEAGPNTLSRFGC